MTRALLTNLLWTAFSIALVFFAMQGLPQAAEACRGQFVKASWYGLESCHPGKRCQTATGRAFDGRQWLVASRTLPFGTKLRLTYGGHSVTVPVGDRGPYHRDARGNYDRQFDLSRVVAEALGTIQPGVATVCAERL